jgi:hypothetical protein
MNVAESVDSVSVVVDVPVIDIVRCRNMIRRAGPGIVHRRNGSVIACAVYFKPRVYSVLEFREGFS